MDVNNQRNELIANIINVTTGEVIDSIYEGDRVVHSGKIRDAKPDYPTVFWDNDDFHKGYNKELKLLMSELSTAEKSLLFSVMPYIQYDSCCLSFDDNTDIQSEDMADICGISRKTAYFIIDVLVQKDILYRGKNSRGRQYYINPWLFSKGNRINKTLKSMFKNYKIRSLNNKKWSQLK